MRKKDSQKSSPGGTKQDIEAKCKLYIRDIPDWPKKGILFRDISPLLAKGTVFNEAIAEMSNRFRNENISIVAGIEARGFIIGGAMAHSLGCGFAPIRKRGKLPYRTSSATYSLEYGADSLEIHIDAIAEGQRVLIVDDVLATGGTARAAHELVTGLGGIVVGSAFLIELMDLNGRSKLECPAYSLIHY